jgi:hypothetical protein
MTGWILTAVFAGAGSWLLRHGVRSGVPATVRISHGVHGVMAAAMIAMVWPWGMELPAAPWLAALGLAGIWFLASTRDAGGVHHALMAAAMAWMVIVPAHHHQHPVPTGVLVASTALVAYFGLATVPWFAAAVYRRASGAGAHAVLSAGMSVQLALPLLAHTG